MSNSENIERADRASMAMIQYGGDESDVTDLITDLLHYCRIEGADFDDHLRIARNHFNDEK